MSALEAQAKAARLARQFRLHLAMGAMHLRRADDCETAVNELLEQCTPAAQAELLSYLEGVPRQVAQTEGALG